jgi:hypothetical protein
LKFFAPIGRWEDRKMGGFHAPIFHKKTWILQRRLQYPYCESMIEF